uniref:Secreted protein n=2 Tax=Oryza TaxID=4527 RepID=Q2QM19_ORYSJ|nr:hypothetical protein LOC_Os12g42590 [Oryza sativa Japonica Group]
MRACAALVYCSFVIIVQSTISDQGVIFGEYVSEFSCSNGTFLQPPLCASVWRLALFAGCFNDTTIYPKGLKPQN